MITELNHYLHGKCDTSLLLFLVISLMSLKKILNITGCCVAPSPTPSPPPGKRNSKHGPPLRLCLSFRIFLIYISLSSHDPRLYLDLNPIPTFHLLLGHLPTHLIPSSSVYRIHVISTFSVYTSIIHLISYLHCIYACHCVMSFCLCHTVIHICHLVTCQLVMTLCHITFIININLHL